MGVNANTLIELAAAFLFLVGLFWAHGRISQIVNSRGFRRLHSTIRPVLEIVLVIVTTVILVYLLNYLPLQLFFAPEEFLPERLRNAFVLSIIISLFFYYFVERERSKRELQEEMLHSARLQKENFEAQLQNLKNQVNPHFLFNSLNVLSSLIHTDQEQAEEFVRRLSDVYRSFLDSSNKTLVPLKKEIEVAEAYIYLLKTRFGDAVHFNIEVPSSKLSHQIPPGSLQMLIENAVKHNGSTARNPLLIEIFVEDDAIIVRNKLQPRKENISSTKMGLKNIKSRYIFLTEQEVQVIEAESVFTVKLPLLNTEEYEDSYH